MAIVYPQFPGIPQSVNPLSAGLSGLMDGFEAGRQQLQEKRGVDAFGRYLDTTSGAPMSLSALGGAKAPVQTASATRTPTPRASANIPSGQRAAYIRNGLISRGLPEHVADGFLVNFQDESGLDPGINERNPLVAGSRGGFGLYQLTGPRRRMYESFARDRGVDPSDIDAQLDFLKFELGGPEAKAASAIMSSKDRAGAAQAIVTNFLRPAPEHQQSRSARYASLGGGVQMASADGSGPSPETMSALMGGVEQAQGGSAPMREAFPQFTPPQQVAQALPDRDTMLELFRNPGTRPLAIEIAKRAQAGAAPSETFSTFQREDGSVWQMSNLTGQINRVAEGRSPERGVTVGNDIVDPTNGRVIYDGPEAPGYRILQAEERAGYGIPADDTRVYQVSPQNQLAAVGGGGQERNPGVEARQRRDLAATYGIDPNSAEGQRFILTGTLPASDKGVTAGDRQAIREADDMVASGEAAVGLLNQALKLSDKAYEGMGAGIRATIGAQFGSEGALATREYDNIVTEQALGQLKAIFGGAPTEGERAILLEIQGSSSQPKEVRDNILRRAVAAAQRRIAFNQDRASELRGGTYYNPREGRAAPTLPAAQQVAPENPIQSDTVTVPAGVDPEDWKYMTPEERAAWQ